MISFVDRMAAQRRVLQVVNERLWNEELFGLSSFAIERWATANRLESGSVEVRLIVSVADALSFLATRSQEQVSEEYERTSARIHDLVGQLADHFEKVTSESI
jgi:hypothetical protein